MLTILHFLNIFCGYSIKTEETSFNHYQGRNIIRFEQNGDGKIKAKKSGMFIVENIPQPNPTFYLRTLPNNNF